MVTMARHSQIQARHREENDVRVRLDARQQEGAEAMLRAFLARKIRVDIEPEAPAILPVQHKRIERKAIQWTYRWGHTRLQLPHGWQGNSGRCEAEVKGRRQSGLAFEESDLPTSVSKRRIDRETIGAVLRRVSAAFDVSIERLMQRSRGWSDMEASHARMAAYAIASQQTNLSLYKIGMLVGRRHHTTVMHGLKRVEELCGSDPDFAARYMEAMG